jgi:hypothetical protein
MDHVSVLPPKRRRTSRQTSTPVAISDTLVSPRPQGSDYVKHLRQLLVERLKLEEEYERLSLYLQDMRLVNDVGKTKWELGRVIIDMLHCPMRMNEKVLHMLYFAAMERLGTKKDWDPVLTQMSTVFRNMGSLPAKWSHTFETITKKDGTVIRNKLEPFHLNYDASKNMFNSANKQQLLDVIKLALQSPTDVKNWQDFMTSYLNVLEVLTLHRDYKPGEIDKLERRIDKMYTLLITKIGGLEAITNYFHYVGAGHVVWMCRMYGNLWRYRNEGVEAFNKILTIRYSKHNNNGGRKSTPSGADVELCPEFWSLGQWLGRWTMWGLGYGDAMDLDRVLSGDTFTPGSDEGLLHLCSSASDSDESYIPSPGSRLILVHSGSDMGTANEDDDYDSHESDTNSSVVSLEFLPSTPLELSLRECRSRHLLRRQCIDLSVET